MKRLFISALFTGLLILVAFTVIGALLVIDYTYLGTTELGTFSYVGMGIVFLAVYSGGNRWVRSWTNKVCKDDEMPGLVVYRTSIGPIKFYRAKPRNVEQPQIKQAA